MNAFAGMDRDTGRLRIGTDHLQQSLTDLLSVPIGSRLQRRGYGLPIEVMDMPLNAHTMIEVVAAVAKAIRRWEPRIILRRVQVEEAGPNGHAVLLLTADLSPGAPRGIELTDQALRIPLRPPAECQAP